MALLTMGVHVSLSLEAEEGQGGIGEEDMGPGVGPLIGK